MWLLIYHTENLQILFFMMELKNIQKDSNDT